MSKSLFTLVIVGAVSFTAVEVFSHGWGNDYGHMGQGFGQRGPGYNNFSRIDSMKEWLGLSEKQIEKVFKIGSRYREKFLKIVVIVTGSTH